MKTIRVSLSENFQFWEVKISIYLYRRVFIMWIKENKILKWSFLQFMPVPSFCTKETTLLACIPFLLKIALLLTHLCRVDSSTLTL